MKTPNEIFVEVSEIVTDYSVLLPKTRAGYRPYIFGQTVKPSEGSDNGHYYQCTTAGMSGLAEPTWPTGSGSTITDGSVVWTEAGAIADSIGNRLLKFLNEAIHIMSVNLDLPALEKEPTDLSTDTSANNVALPTDYHRELFLCENSDGDELRIYPNLQTLERDYPEEYGDTGDVEAVAIRSGRLYYQYVPEISETLKISYFKKPTPVTSLTTVPADLVGIDDSIADLSLINYISYKLFDLIEIDSNGTKPNADRKLNAFNSILAKQKFLTQGQTMRIDSFRG